MMTPKLIIVSAPSGTGKTTLCDRLLQDYPELVYSISCTTREPRGEEEDGVDYHFVSRERFQKLIEEDAFLEHAEVHGNYYGTLAEPIRVALRQGLSILLDIDVAGAAQVREEIGRLEEGDPLYEGLIDIFISPPTMEALRDRLEGRGEDAPEVIEKRLRNAELEMACVKDYSFHVVNGDLEIAYKELRSILEVKNAVEGAENTNEAEEGVIRGRSRGGHEHCECGHEHGHEDGHKCCGRHEHDHEGGHKSRCHHGDGEQ